MHSKIFFRTFAKEIIRTTIIMKNIFLLPTDKPSKLSKFLCNSRELYKTNELALMTELVLLSDCWKNQNIYITNDEEIKEGDWYITILDNEIVKADSFTIRIMNDANKYSDTTYKNTHFKIILTTDQELIKDGVQSIDDEFLEWFVKNPSCEEVEVMNVPDFIYQTKHSCYKIIIPKEEPKQETLEELIEERIKGINVDTGFRLVQQETLEEAIKKYPLINQRIGFKLGVKWQQERSYSEEEVHSILNSFKSLISSGYNKPYFDWFEQFKKK